MSGHSKWHNIQAKKADKNLSVSNGDGRLKNLPTTYSEDRTDYKKNSKENGNYTEIEEVEVAEIIIKHSFEDFEKLLIPLITNLLFSLLIENFSFNSFLVVIGLSALESSNWEYEKFRLIFSKSSVMIGLIFKFNPTSL